MKTSQLPVQPTHLQNPVLARVVREALEKILKGSPELFNTVFCLSHKDHEIKTRLETSFGRELGTLVDAGILYHDKDKCYRSTYLVTPWNGMIYLTDFPDTGHVDEVFSPHVETKFFSSLLQVRPNDNVLDLCTGGGMLLLEAARRGASGLGIDISPRAISFAKANAAINGLQERVQFDEGDVTAPSALPMWGSPDVVISNPPFEPVPDDPGFPRRPIHSDAGPQGTKIIESILQKLAEWSHKPEVVQFILFALGKDKRESRKYGGEHIPFIEDLRRTAQSINAALDVRELLRGIKIDDYRVLNFGRGRHDSEGWFQRLKEEGLITLHLIFTNMYPAPDSKTLQGNFRWIQHEDSGREDECFLWPISSTKREGIHKYLLGEANLYAQYIKALIETRESAMANKKIDLALEDEHVRNTLFELIKDDSMFDGTDPIILVDVQKDSAKSESGSSTSRGVVTITKNTSTFNEFTSDQLAHHIKKHLGEDRIGISVCDALEPRNGDDGHLAYYVDIGSLSSLLADVMHFERGDRVLQRFVAFTAYDKCLSPARQKFFANILSEMVGVADRERAKSYEALQNAGFVFGHDLKNRLEELGYREVLQSLRANKPGSLEMAKACLEKLVIFSAIPELFRVMGKFVSGELPRVWAKQELIENWPNNFDAEHLTKAAIACETIIRQVVAPYVKELTVDGEKIDFELRRIEDQAFIKMDPLDEVVEIDLPPVCNRPSIAPPFAILAGLAEIVRNAIKSVTDEASIDDIQEEYGKLHLDYEVHVEADLEQVRVTIWNPFCGQDPPVSETINRLVPMYKQLRAVEIRPVNTESPHPIIREQSYGRSEFIFRPKQLRFARKS
jgi:2-polyprenyl-3-methyl-5-hydroxy-6-metoxy-1,4-benzoquinol methylase